MKKAGEVLTLTKEEVRLLNHHAAQLEGVAAEQRFDLKGFKLAAKEGHPKPRSMTREALRAEKVNEHNAGLLRGIVRRFAPARLKKSVRVAWTVD